MRATVYFNRLVTMTRPFRNGEIWTGREDCIGFTCTRYGIRCNPANIETSSSNLLSLINDILDLSRIEAGRIELDVRSVDVRALAGECADALEPIVKSGVELRRELEVIDEIRTDPDRLRQVVMNLLGNATKFTDRGCITLGVAPTGRPAAHLRRVPSGREAGRRTGGGDGSWTGDRQEDRRPAGRHHPGG
jgi:hypothetical protein